jgi:hypothetical protein
MNMTTLSGIEIYRPDHNIKEEPFRKLVEEDPDVTLITTFYNTKGSASVVKYGKANKYPRVIILLFDFNSDSRDEVIRSCEGLAVSVYSAKLVKNHIRFKTICANGIIMKEYRSFTLQTDIKNYISTNDYKSVAVKLGNHLMAKKEINSHRVIGFGFSEVDFICHYSEFLKSELKPFTSIENIFMVIGSGTTLVALFHALDIDVTFHCTVVGKKVDEDYIKELCPGIKVKYYKSEVKYTESIENFATDEYESEKMNSLMDLCRHYDSKLLYGVKGYLIEKKITFPQLENSLLFHVMTV